jgi:CRISPR type III-B/RAMP module-associated protein Cmr5
MSMHSALQSYEQQVAKAAWDRVNEARKHLGKDHFKTYKGLADSAPTMILSIGLAATVAFYLSKGKDAHKRLVADWAHILDKQADKSLIDHLLSDVDTYRMATDTIMRHQEWIKRFAKAAQQDKETGS